MAFVVVDDACALYPAGLRDLLIRLAQTDIVRAQWSERILEECFCNILKNWPDLTAAGTGASARMRQVCSMDMFARGRS